LARKILRADIAMVSLCRRGMNRLKTLYKGADGVRIDAMVKATDAFDERGELLAVVAVPGLTDAEDDVWVDEDAVRKAAHSFMRAGAELDVQHNGKPLSKGEAYVAESFVIQKGDPRFAGWETYEGDKVDVAGGWGMLVRVEDEALRKGYRAGEWDGVSLFAPEARVEPIEKAEDDLAAKVRAELVKAGITQDEDDDVTIEEIKKALAEDREAMVASLVKLLKGDEKPAGDKPADPKPDDGAPVFKGDLTDPDALRKHAAAVQLHKMTKDGTINDPDEIAKLIKAAEDAKVDPKAAREALRATQPDLAKALDEKDAAEAKVAKLQKTSNQEPGDPKTPGTENPLVKAGLLSEDKVSYSERAVKAAKALNKQREQSGPVSAGASR